MLIVVKSVIEDLMLFVFLRNQAIRRLGPSLPLFQKARMCNPPHSYIPSLTKSVPYTF